MSPARRIAAYAVRQLLVVLALGTPAAVATWVLLPRLYVGLGEWLVGRGLDVMSYVGAWAIVAVACVILCAVSSVRAFRAISSDIRSILVGTS